MKYRILGRTGLKVSILSFGASPLGGVFGAVDETDGIQSVHTAIDLGINLIDVSPYYGLTKAEAFLGKALKGIPRDKYILATKVGRYGDDFSQFDFSEKRITQSIDESLQRMKLDHIDLIQCHDVEFGSLDQIINETIPALEKIRQTGKVRFIGITGLPLKVFRYILERKTVDTILSYCHYSLNDTALKDLIPFLKEKETGIISASPLSMGLLSRRGAPDWHPASSEVKSLCKEVVDHCQSKGVDISKLALQFALAQPDIHTTLVGISKTANIKKNVEWMNEPIDQQLLAEVRQILSPIHNKTWVSGHPANNDLEPAVK